MGQNEYGGAKQVTAHFYSHAKNKGNNGDEIIIFIFRLEWEK